MFLGDIARKPRILEKGDQVAPEDEHLVMQVPVDFRPEFERDILAAIRDIAGRSTFALNPFIMNQNAVAACFGKRRPVLSLPSCDFETSRPLIYVDYIERPEEPRFAHVDLGLTNDSAGVAVGWVSGFTKIKRGAEHWEILPVIEMDLVLEVKPPRNGEIEFDNIRRLFYRLREAGMNLKWITFDTYQSRDSVQLLRQKGLMSDLVSVDTDFVPYEVTKTAFYDGRIRLQEHDKALQELVRLERDPRTGKVNHPPAGSKDCSDAIAGGLIKKKLAAAQPATAGAAVWRTSEDGQPTMLVVSEAGLRAIGLSGAEHPAVAPAHTRTASKPKVQEVT